MSLENENLSGIWNASKSEPAEVHPVWPGIYKATVANSGGSLQIMDG